MTYTAENFLLRTTSWKTKPNGNHYHPNNPPVFRILRTQQTPLMKARQRRMAQTIGGYSTPNHTMRTKPIPFYQSPTAGRRKTKAKRASESSYTPQPPKDTQQQAPTIPKLRASDIQQENDMPMPAGADTTRTEASTARPGTGSRPVTRGGNRPATAADVHPRPRGDHFFESSSRLAFGTPGEPERIATPPERKKPAFDPIRDTTSRWDYPPYTLEQINKARSDKKLAKYIYNKPGREQKIIRQRLWPPPKNFYRFTSNADFMCRNP